MTESFYSDLIPPLTEQAVLLLMNLPVLPLRAPARRVGQSI